MECAISNIYSIIIQIGAYSDDHMAFLELEKTWPSLLRGEMVVQGKYAWCAI